MEVVSNISYLENPLGCKLEVLPLKYLGLPLRAFFKAKSIKNGIVEKIEKRLVGWKHIYFLKGGKLILLEVYFIIFLSVFFSFFLCLRG